MSNSVLVDYGIQTENSDLRAHVCPLAGYVYVYPTSCGVSAIRTGKFRKVGGYQPGVSFKTSEGFLVPPGKIERCVPLYARKIIDKYDFREDDSTTEKGEKACKVVEHLLRSGWFSLPISPDIVTNAHMQVTGVDIIVQSGFRIQVKCDYGGGDKKHNPRVTGNLFLQVAECNPLGNI